MECLAEFLFVIALLCIGVFFMVSIFRSNKINKEYEKRRKAIDDDLEYKPKPWA